VSGIGGLGFAGAGQTFYLEAWVNGSASQVDGATDHAKGRAPMERRRQWHAVFP